MYSTRWKMGLQFVVLLLSLDRMAVAAPLRVPTFLAAAAEVNITPAIGVRLVGPGSASTGVADELFARVLVLSDGKAPVVIVTSDLAGVGIRYAEAVGAAIEKKTGIPPGRVMFNCSHTHSGPGAALPADDSEKSYGRDVFEKVVAATVDCAGRLEPARLRAGREAVQKQACQAFPDPYADDLKAGANRNFQVLSPLDFLAPRLPATGHAAHSA